MTNREKLTQLKAQRDALNDEILLIEKAIGKAAYDACMQEQLLAFNERRIEQGKRQVTASEYSSGLLEFIDECEKGQ